jgi:hypothetical protein
MHLVCFFPARFLGTSLCEHWFLSALCFFDSIEFGYIPVPSCPSHCGEDEDWSHFLRCSHPQRKQLWRDFYKMTMALLERCYVDPSLRRIVMVLRAPFVDLTPPPILALAPEYTILLEHQIGLGPHSIFFGFLPPAWSTIQHRYLTPSDLPRDKQRADRWMKAITHHCHNVSRTLWLLHNSHLHSILPTSNGICSPSWAQDRDIFSLQLKDRQLQSTRI